MYDFPSYAESYIMNSPLGEYFSQINPAYLTGAAMAKQTFKSPLYQPIEGPPMVSQYEGPKQNLFDAPSSKPEPHFIGHDEILMHSSHPLVNPAIVDAQQQEQQQEQSPIVAGIEAAQDTSKQKRLELSDAQRQAALGRMIAHMATTFSTSKSPTVLGSLNEGWAPGIEAMVAEQSRHHNINKDEELLEQKERDYELDKEYKMGMLDVHRKELELKGKAGKYAGLTESQRLNHIRNTVTAIGKSMDRTAINQEKIYKTAKEMRRDQRDKYIKDELAKLERRERQTVRGHMNDLILLGEDPYKFYDTDFVETILGAGTKEEGQGSYQTAESTPETKKDVIPYTNGRTIADVDREIAEIKARNK